MEVFREKVALMGVLKVLENCKKASAGGNGVSRGRRGPELAGLTCGARAEGQAGGGAQQERRGWTRSWLPRQQEHVPVCWEPSRGRLGAHKAEGPGGGPASPCRSSRCQPARRPHCFVVLFNSALGKCISFPIESRIFMAKNSLFFI